MIRIHRFSVRYKVSTVNVLVDYRTVHSVHDGVQQPLQRRQQCLGQKEMGEMEREIQRERVRNRETEKEYRECTENSIIIIIVVVVVIVVGVVVSTIIVVKDHVAILSIMNNNNNNNKKTSLS